MVNKSSKSCLHSVFLLLSLFSLESTVTREKVCIKVTMSSILLNPVVTPQSCQQQVTRLIDLIEGIWFIVDCIIMQNETLINYVVGGGSLGSWVSFYLTSQPPSRMIFCSGKCRKVASAEYNGSGKM